jgi:hypothetical protein
MISPVSRHPNHVHQLSISVSKHYYATKNGCLKYQQKPMALSLATLNDSNRSNMLILSLRDHCSGLFYAELEFGPKIPGIADFLRNAWARKSDFDFCGLPVLLTIPKTVENAYPQLVMQVESLGICVPRLTNGFESGISNVRLIEDSLCVKEGKSIDEAKKWIHDIYRYHADSKARTGRESKLELWRRAVPPIRLLPRIWLDHAQIFDNKN